MPPDGRGHHDPKESLLKIALLCDVDQSIYHVGDEAIATLSTRRLEQRGHEVHRISRHEKYGPGGVQAERTIPALIFPWPLEARTAYLAEIRAVLAGRHDALPSHDKLFGIIDRMREVDAVVIGGGGSLNSRYGWLLDERLATALVARHLGKPVVLSGQSVGPMLTDSDRRSLTELLGLCELVGLRDRDSVRIARQLAPEHPAIVQTLDDAVGLGADRAPTPDPALISVTLGADGDPLPREDYVAVAAAVIDALAERTGAEVEFVPHMADQDEGRADEELHADVAELLERPARIRSVERDDISASRTAAAGWVITTRFHPVVFGTTAGASVLALPLNRYGQSRMDGALRNVGLGQAAVPFAALWDPSTAGPSPLLASVIDELVSRSETERQHLQEVRPQVLAAAEEWWDRIDETMRRARAGAEGAPRNGGIVDPKGAGIVVDERWSEALRAQLRPFIGPAGDPSVAIIMRTRDRARMLDRAVQDVLAQTRQDWELVIVNDAGDPCMVQEVLDRYRVDAADRVRILHLERSTGMEAASNAGLESTTAPLVSVHDDDDTWHGTFLQETLAHLDTHPADGAVVARTVIIRERETEAGFVDDEAFTYWAGIDGVRLLDYVAVNRHVPISMVHRRSVHDELGGFDEEFPVVGDYAFHLAVLQRFPVGFLSRPLAQWRQRPGADGSSSNSMYAQSDGHRHYDAELRERYLRDWTRENGIGLPMFISKNTEMHLERSEERLREELAELRTEIAQLREDIAVTRGGARGVERARNLVRRTRGFAGRNLRRVIAGSRSGPKFHRGN